ncbi:MAG: siderophore-iron reductase FhuF [Rhodocyclaceae bacterium]
MLKPLFPGKLAAYAEALTCGDTASPGLLPLSELLDSPTSLDQLLARQAHLLGCSDRRPVASAWMLKYVGLLLPPVAAAATVLEHVFPVGVECLALRLDEHGTPRAVVIPHLGEHAHGLSSRERYDTLLDSHLTPLIDALSARARLPTKILWGSVSRHLAPLLDQAAVFANDLPPLAMRVAADKDYLLGHEKWPDGRRNPLFGRRRFTTPPDSKATPVLLHRQCCLYYRLPGEGYCTACPLAPAVRGERGLVTKKIPITPDSAPSTTGM